MRLLSHDRNAADGVLPVRAKQIRRELHLIGWQPVGLPTDGRAAPEKRRIVDGDLFHFGCGRARKQNVTAVGTDDRQTGIPAATGGGRKRWMQLPGDLQRKTGMRSG